MQMSDKNNTNKSPPTPLVQTPLATSTIAPVFPNEVPDKKSNHIKTSDNIAANEVSQSQQQQQQHGRSQSQSSATFSVPELVATNNAINNS